MDKYQIIKRPIVTEKTNKLAEKNQYTFEVDRNANKIEIKQAVEALFNVKVKSVNVINEIAKAKKVGQHSGFKPAVSKAIVTLADGFKIDVYTA
ncbi:MAG: 50S ribosomal protein L23 [Candidatus Izemoplasmatales bacterium]|jgi:large subunit ribosomal protein L23|nr:50S ribosomal protein L23 [Candidatus Izemoplasmatales bacterium]MDD4596073.1 50S ribosomal protein L23 [Candidatus Izemoplasmatales bacterium]